MAGPTRSAPVSPLHRRYFEAGMAILAESGHGTLKQSALVQRLGLTTGAFYHAFANWKDFTEGLLDFWHTERTLRVAEVVAVQTDARARVRTLRDAALALDHDAEAAIRAWGGADPGVRRLVEQVDRERLDAVLDATTGVTDDPERAAHLARTALYVLVGHTDAGPSRDPATLAWAFALIEELALGAAGEEPLPPGP